MTNELTTGVVKELSTFKPRESQEEMAKAEAMISYGVEVGSIEIVEKAVDVLCDERHGWLTWWENTERNRRGVNQFASDISVRSILEQLGRTEKEVSRWRKKWGTPELTEQTRTVMKEKARRMIDGTESVQGTKTKNDEWYTPQQYIESARKVMGGIDLDPASSEMAQLTIQADNYFTEDALDRPWNGRIWLNPPFSDVIGFAHKLLSHLESGEVTEAVVLTNNNTDTLWWHLLAQLAGKICFTRGRISFYNQAGEARGNTNGQTFFYFGENIEAFHKEFSVYGLVIK